MTMLNSLTYAKEIEFSQNPPIIPTLYQKCDNDAIPNDNFTSFDLIGFVGNISGYTIAFYTDSMQTQQIVSNPFVNNYPAIQTIYYRLTETSTGIITNGTITLSVVPIPVVNQPQPIAYCDNDGVNDGLYIISLSSLSSSILGSLNPAEYTVNYYLTIADAHSNTNPLNQVVYHCSTQTLYVRVSNSFNCYVVMPLSITIQQKPEPFITYNSSVLCVDFLANSVQNSINLTAVDYTFYNISNTPTYAYQWYSNGNPIAGATASTYTINQPLVNNVSQNYSVQMIPINPQLCSSQFSANITVIQSGQAQPIGIGYTIVNDNGVHNMSIQVQGYGIYEYALDGGPRQSSPIFENVPLGSHNVTVFDIKGGISTSCSPLIITNIEVTNAIVPAPTGSLLQTVPQGSTLANLTVFGQNIQWYSAGTGNKNSNNILTALPINTLLQDGVTYYASQKIGGYESIDRLPVTVNLSLNTSEFNISGLSFYPNPANNSINFKAEEQLTNINIYNVLGQKVYDQDINKLNTVQIDISFLKSGNYFAVIKSNQKQSVLKFIKL